MNGVVLPLWTVVSEVLPGMLEYVGEARQNVGKWEAYEETEEDKVVYKNSKPKPQPKHKTCS